MGPGLTQFVLMPLVDMSMLASAFVNDTMAPCQRAVTWKSADETVISPLHMRSMPLHWSGLQRSQEFVAAYAMLMHQCIAGGVTSVHLSATTSTALSHCPREGRLGASLGGDVIQDARDGLIRHDAACIDDGRPRRHVLLGEAHHVEHCDDVGLQASMQRQP